MVTAFLLAALLFAPAASAFSPRPSLAATKGARLSAPATRLRASLEAILFDCDGVLADTERDGHRLAFNVAFSESGISDEWDEDRYGKLLETGGGKERMTAHWDEVGWPEQIPEDGRTDAVMALHLRKTEVFVGLVDKGAIPLRPGVLRLVDEAIDSGVRLAVCSTSNERAVRGLVTTLMGDHRASKFEIYAGDMVEKKKPAPDVYLMAVDRMGLEASRCVVIEDSHIGLGAAVAAKIACLVTKSSYTAQEDFTGAKMVVDELGDDNATGVTLKTLSSLLPDEAQAPAPASTPASTRGIGVKMEGHIERGGTSWTGARFGDVVPNRPAPYTPSETHGKGARGGTGARMAAHVEAGGPSWAGARFGDEVPNRPVAYTPSETHGLRSGGAGAGWDPAAHAEAPPEGGDGNEWSGARFGDGNVRRAGPTPSQWHE